MGRLYPVVSLRGRLLRFSLLRLVSALCFLAASPLAAAAPVHPKLVIVISVDQLASSVYGRYREDYTGGLKRLSSGIALPVAYQSHAATETCPGHSTILTGDHPSHTGIVANSWLDRSTGASLYCVSVPANGDQSARGPQNLKASTFGEWLKKTYPASRVVSVSGKDRAAIMMAGHNPDLVAWWVDGAGFRTSSFVGPDGPAVESALKREDDSIASAWRTAPPQLWPADVPAYCRALEKPHRFGDVDISGGVPPAAAVQATARPGFIGRSQFFEALHASPLYDKLTLDFAAHLAEKWRLGAGASPDLLAISLSATDYVGHRYGNGGAEMCAQVHALDRSLGAFLKRIDRLHVPYMVALTADHGSVDAPERLREQGIPAERVDTAGLVTSLNKHLKQTLGLASDPIKAVDAQQLYLVPPPDQSAADRVRAEAVSWLNQQPSVAAVMTRDEVAAAIPPPGKLPSDLTLAERLNESFDPERSADIFVVFKQFATLGWPHGPSDSVAGHGSPWDYDRQVPILFWWRGAPAITLPAPAETVDIAPTLASIVGATPPVIDGHCLSQVATCGLAPAPARGQRGR